MTSKTALFLELFVRVKNPSESYYSAGSLDLLTAKSSNPSLMSIELEEYPGWGTDYHYPWNPNLRVSEGVYDYIVYHFVARVVDPTALKKKSETVKFNITTLDGAKKLTYSLKVKK